MGWLELGSSGPLLVAAVLLLRRPPVLLLLRPLLPDVRTTSESLFMGWFGPIAVAAIYYASLMEHRTGEAVIWHVVSLVICGSVIVHGATGAPLTPGLGTSPWEALTCEMKQYPWPRPRCIHLARRRTQIETSRPLGPQHDPGAKAKNTTSGCYILPLQSLIQTF
nr:hypothetical protein [Paracoccus saliphilus]